MKRRSLLGTALLGTSLLFGCGDSDGRIPIVVYSPHGPDILEEFADRFEEAHPDADVRAQNMPTGEILTRVRAEAPNPRADIWWGAPSSTFSRAADEGLLESHRPTYSDAVDPTLLHPNNLFAPHFIIPQVILFNRDRMESEEAPEDWDDLLDEEWKGRIILRYPMPSGSMRTAFSWLVDWKSEGADNPDRGFAFLEDLHRNTKKYTANPNELFLAIQRDPDRPVGIWNLTDILFQREEKGFPFGVKIPTSGVPVVVDSIALVRNPDRDPRRTRLAREFYDFVTSTTAAESLMNRHMRIPVRNDIPEDIKPTWLKEHPFTPLPIDPARPASREDEWMNHWDTRIKPLDHGKQ